MCSTHCKYLSLDSDMPAIGQPQQLKTTTSNVAPIPPLHGITRRTAQKFESERRKLNSNDLVQKVTEFPIKFPTPRSPFPTIKCTVHLEINENTIQRMDAYASSGFGFKKNPPYYRISVILQAQRIVHERARVKKEVRRANTINKLLGWIAVVYLLFRACEMISQILNKMKVQQVKNNMFVQEKE